MAGKLRKRRSHFKTRNGCQICKNRHLKCDQSWPYCEQCSSTGRQCDGYDMRSGAMFTPRHMAMQYFRETFCPSPVSPVRPYGNRSTEEIRSIHYFQTRTVSALSGFFDTGVWESLPLSIGQIEPAVLHVVIALSTYHELSENVGPGDCWDIHRSTSSDATFRFAAEHYSAAVSSFRKKLSADELSSAEVELLCILLACVEFLRGYRESALIHFSGAMSFIQSRHQESCRSREETALKSLLARMSVTQSLYGRPRGLHCPDLLDLHESSSGLQDGKFCDLNEARMESTCLINSVFRFVRMVFYDHFPDAFTALAAQISLERELQQWSIAFEAFANDSAMCSTDLRGHRLLRIHHLIATIYVLASGAKRESSFDVHLSKLEALLSLVEDILSQETAKERSRSSPFSLDVGIIPPLFYTAIKCRFPMLRRKAIALLRRAPRKEGLGDAIESAKAAELAMDFEEQYLTDDTSFSHSETQEQRMEDDVQFCHSPIPEWARVHDVDIFAREPSDPSRQLVILRWKPNGEEMQETHSYIQW